GRSPPRGGPDPGGSAARGRAGSTRSAADTRGEPTSRAAPRTRRRTRRRGRRRRGRRLGCAAYAGGQLLQHARDEPVELLERAVVDVRVVRPGQLLIVRNQPSASLVDRGARALLAELRRRRHDDDDVEAILGADLVQERNLGRAHRRWSRKLGQLLAPLEVLPCDSRMQERLEPGELLRVAEDDLCDGGAVDLARLVEDALPEALEQGAAHLVVLADQAVDDLVARDDGRSVTCKGSERLALPRADAARDGDGNRLRHYSGA